MNLKDYIKIVEDSKKTKHHGPTKRNPMAKELVHNSLFRTKVEPSVKEKEAKRDSWDRSAKHKNRDYE